MGVCAHKMKLEACYARSRRVMGVVEQSGSEQNAEALSKRATAFTTHVIGILRA